MRRQKRLAVLLAILILCIAAAVLISRINFEEKMTGTETTIIDVESSDITRLARNYEEEVAFVYEDEEWKYEEDDQMPADQELLAEIAENLSSITSDKMVEEPQALSVYGLDDPTYTLTVETGDTVYEISIGDESFSDGEVYISTGDDYVYLTNSELIDQISYSLLDCVQKEEIPEMETVNSVSVDKEEAVEDYRNLDNDSTEEAVSAMTEFSWTECVDYHAEESELKDYGLDEPDASVTVSYTDEDGESGEFAYELGQSGEKYYAKLKDSSIIYTVEQEVYDAAVNASYEELKPDEAILLDWDTVESIEIEMDGSTYSIGVQSNGEDEYTYTFDDSEAEFGDALDELENISIDPEEEAELNDNKAELSLTFRRNTEEYSTVELDFYQHNGTYCIAVLDGEVTGCVAREDVVSLKEAVNTVVLGGEEE